MTSKQKLCVDVVLLVMAPVAWLSGLVLFVAFHVGGGCLRSEALGLSRLVWQNTHRVSAVAVLGGVAIHVAANARPILRRALRVLHGRPARHDTHELVLYATSATVLITGFVAWLAVAGSPPLWGPVTLGPVAAARHPWLDVHNLTALVAIVLSINHIRRRWRALGHLL
jgi:hypothetical protein